MIKFKVTGAGDYLLVEFTRGKDWVASGFLPKRSYSRAKAELWATKQSKVYKPR